LFIPHPPSYILHPFLREARAMTDQPRLQQLLDELMDSHATPEEVCRSCPELLPEVRERWRQVRRVQAELDALFPPQPDPCTHPPTLPLEDPALPRIPGYGVEAVLGRGGMGVVYKARHLRLNRTVALKMLLAGAYATPHERARFQREAEAVAGLRHANVVQVHDVADHEGRPYFTMEFVEGGSLAQKLAGTPQPARQAAGLLATLAGAVQVAHQGGVVHRDLKPANILLTGDGTPKIADFGLARHVDGGPTLTLSGARLGTPSYMAPEQVIGKAGTLGPAVDIWALGAILYELLTGRPPFRAETALETERQVIAEEPVPPSRLNTKVPLDLETICLKCLRKDPARRYPSAAALADDLQRFLRGEAIVARPAGPLERLGKWVRRRPSAAAMLAASLFLAVALVGLGSWLVVQRAQLRDAVVGDLKEATQLQNSARWTEAQAALQRAERRLDWFSPTDLVRRLGQARRDLGLVIQLDEIRLKRVTRGLLPFYRAQASRDYAEAFEGAGLGTIHDEPSGVAARIDASEVHGALVAAVYDWAVCAPDRAQRAWLLEVARQTASTSDGWRERVLDPAAWEDLSALTELARTAPVKREAVPLLLAFGERLMALYGDAAPYLQRVQKEHPADFWANLIVGNAMVQWAPQEAAGYYRAVLASRPWAAVSYCAVGDALRVQNRLGEATDYYRKALEHDPNYSRAHSDLGLVLQTQGRLDEAIDCQQTALRLDPDYAWAHYNLGNALRDKGRLNEAYHHFQEVLRVDPTNSEVHYSVSGALVPQGRGREAQAGWQKAIAANPPEYVAWSGYAELCLFLGQQDDYRRARRGLLQRFRDTQPLHIAESVGRACLLLPGTPDEVRQAVALVDRAFADRSSAAAWIARYYLFAKGLAEYRQGRSASTITLMQGEASRVMGPAPDLLLAMALHDQGQKEQARKTLARAVLSFDWSAVQADSRDVWICHILRREAETLILPNLPAFLRGEHQPRDNDERLALVGICQFQGRCRAVAQLFADAFTADPDLAESLSSIGRSRVVVGDKQPIGRLEELAAQCRYPAARCAALTGCGLARDGAKIGEAERTRWRRQARAWLRADLALWARTLDSGSPAARVLIRKMLAHWQVDPDLAGLREARALAQLSADERKECLALWQEVGSLLRRAREGT
jgi:serine/threonine-protein kinase